MARLTPLSPEELAKITEVFQVRNRSIADVPNSVRTLALTPHLLAPLLDLWQAVMYEGEVDLGLKWLVGHIASHAHGCRYCMAHTAHGASRSNVPEDKVKAIWEFNSSPLFSEAERAALELSMAAAVVPNAATDEHFESLKIYFSEPQIAEILAVVSLYGFYNRWNDTVATFLETDSRTYAETQLAPLGWDVGAHGEKGSSM